MNQQIRRQTLGDLLRRSAARNPRKTAIVCGELRWSYAELDALCNRLANGLAASGVAAGDRVAILSRNSRAFAVVRFALARIGAVLVPINFMLNAEEAAYILRHAGARCGPGPTWSSSRMPPPPGTPRWSASSGCPVRTRRRPRREWRISTSFSRMTPANRRRKSIPARCSRSSTPAAPSRCPRAPCSPTRRCAGNMPAA